MAQLKAIILARETAQVGKMVPLYYLFHIFGYPKFIFGYVFLDIHNSFLDIYAKSIYGYPKKHFWISKNQLNIGYP